MPRGLVVVIGTSSSGKITAVASMVDYINETECEHILTIEDPIEFVHQSKKCLVNQR
jgi:twitching motility protein PilT